MRRFILFCSSCSSAVRFPARAVAFVALYCSTHCHALLTHVPPPPLLRYMHSPQIFSRRHPPGIVLRRRSYWYVCILVLDVPVSGSSRSLVDGPSPPHKDEETPTRRRRSRYITRRRRHRQGIGLSSSSSCRCIVVRPGIRCRRRRPSRMCWFLRGQGGRRGTGLCIYY